MVLLFENEFSWWGQFLQSFCKNCPHPEKLHCRNGVVDTFGLCLIWGAFGRIEQNMADSLQLILLLSLVKAQIMKIKCMFKKDFNPVVWLFEQNLGAVKQNDYFPFPHKNASAKAWDADFRHPCKTFWGGFHLYLFPFDFPFNYVAN